MIKRLTDRPAEIHHGSYAAKIDREEATPWGTVTRWLIVRDGQTVGKMFQDDRYFDDGVRCTMSELCWSGPWPKGHDDPRSEHYGILFDVGPCKTREAALEKFATQADRLIAWREANRSE